MGYFRYKSEFLDLLKYIKKRRNLCIKKNTKIAVAIIARFVYTGGAVTLIAMKREVAAVWQVFRGANVK